MNLTVLGQETYCYTGGKPFNAAQPTAIFIHGVLNDHSVWILQSRYLAHHGWNVLCVDLPGHCRSAGEVPQSVEAAAKFVAALMDAAGLERAALIGHSWGSLIALQAAADLQARVSHLVMVGTASPMKVSPALLESSRTDPLVALKMIQVFSRSTLGAGPSVLGPGTWVYGVGMALGKRVLVHNPQAFYLGFKACDSYTGGPEAMARISCPVLLVLGEQDQMTPSKAAQGLVHAAQTAGKSVQVVQVPVGHHQMAEAPELTLKALQGFLAA
jgi:pimeloyl-ACP methyl ester carboxylesterase